MLFQYIITSIGIVFNVTINIEIFSETKNRLAWFEVNDFLIDEHF